MKRKSVKTKTIIVAVVVIMAILGLSAVAIGVFGNPEKSVSPDYERGKLDANGKYVESNVTLYTPDPIECQGLNVAFDFEHTGEYQIFWYNEDDLFLHSEERTDAPFVGPVPNLAKYCRIVIYPVLEEDEEEISWFGIGKYSDNLNVTVDRYQEFSPENHYETAKHGVVTSDVAGAKDISSSFTFIRNAKIDNSGDLTSFSEGITEAADGFNVVKLNCSEVSSYKLKFDKVCEGGKYHVFFFKADGSVIEPATEILVNEGGSIVISVPSDAAYACFNVYPADLMEGGKDIPIVINEYLPR